MINELLQQTARASQTIISLNSEIINHLLSDTALALIDYADEVLAANKKDLARMDADNPKYDRLMLTKARLKGIADDMK
ncbi:MAG: gamma-glutamyl-phosphate reductase, partial [Tannerellaceae bacterium]